jgi:hypothetical protein
MTASTRAVITLEARRDAGDYPFKLENLDDPGWWLRFPEIVREKITREEAIHHLREIEDEEKVIRQFIAQAARLYETAGFDRIGFVFLSTDAPDAVTTYVQKDDSFAIGLDHSMTVLFSVVFSALLDAKLLQKKNLTWVMALHDFVFKIFAKQHSPAVDQRILQRRYAPTIEIYTKKASAMAGKFLIAHELGHVYFDHPKQKRLLLASLLAEDDKDAKLAKFDQNAEFEADEWGAQLLRQTAGSDPLSLALVSYIPQIYFGVFSMARQLYVPRDVFGQVLRDSHPDPWERTIRLAKSAASAETKPSDPADYGKKCRILAELFSAIGDERHDSVFLGAAADFRRRLAEVPPSPDDLSKRVPLSRRLEKFSAYCEQSAFVRWVLLRTNIVYYLASAAALWSRTDQRWPLLLLALISVMLAFICFKLAAYTAARRWNAAAYGESFGLLPRGGIYIAQTAFFLRVSAWAFCIAAVVHAVMFLY